RCLTRQGLPIPADVHHTSMEASLEFLQLHQAVVVKPADSEQGKGISCDVRDEATLTLAIDAALKVSGNLLLETYHPGQDLRLVVIGYDVVAAAIRRPAEIGGDCTTAVEMLIETQSRRRSAATGGESRIPVDDETLRCLHLQGLDWHSVLEEGRIVQVRKTANLHTGGTLIDVTDQLHPALKLAAEQAARALEIP